MDKSLHLVWLMVPSMLLIPGFLKGQTPDFIWANGVSGTVSETGNCIAADNSGNTYIAGQFESPSLTFGNKTIQNTGYSGTDDIFIVKYDSAGNVIWAKRAGGYGNDIPRNITVDIDGNIYLTGSFSDGSVFFNNIVLDNSGMEDFFIAKYNSAGTAIWAKSASGIRNDIGYGITTDTSRNVIITGSFSSPLLKFNDSISLTNSGQYTADFFLVKYNSTGKAIWAVNAKGKSNNDDKGISVVSDIEGNLFFSGSFTSDTISFDTAMIINSNSGLSDIFMGKCSNTGSFLWVKGYGSVDNERPSGMTLDFTGNIYLTGVFNSVSLSFGSTSLGNAGSYDIFICKFDSGGNTVWAKSIGNSQDDFSFEIACDASGNAIITGEFSSPTLLINPFTLINNGISDIFCVKYSGQGIVDWAKNFGNEEVEGGYDVAVNPAGRINITGAYQSSFITFDTKTMMNSGGFDVFTACLNPSGTTRWAATAGGSDDNDGGNSIAVDAADNAVITGFFKSPVISFGSNILYNEGSSDIFIAKYSPTGKILWANSAAGIYEDNATGIAADGEGNTVITGYFFSNKIYMGGFDLTLTGNGYPDIFIAKYDSLGNVTWVSQGKGSNYDKSNCIAVSASGSIYIAGMFWSPTLTFDAISVNRTGTGYNDIFVTKYNPAGIAFWAKSIGGDNFEEATAITVDGSGYIYVTGYFNSPEIILDNDTLTNNGMSDIIIFKLNSGGNVIWAKSIGGTGDDRASSIVPDDNGNIFITGNFNSPSLQFDNITVTNIGGKDVFIAKYNSDGEAQWAIRPMGSNDDFATGVTVDDSGFVYTTGYFQSSFITFESTILNNTNQNYSDIFLAKFTQSGNLIWAKKAGGNSDEKCNGIIHDRWNNIFLTGFYESSPVVFGNTSLFTSDNQDIFIAKFGIQETGLVEIEGNPQPDFSLYPNPAVSNVFIDYTLAEDAFVDLDVFNSSGEKIALISDGRKQRYGNYHVSFSPMIPGIYFIRLRIFSESASEGDGLKCRSGKFIFLK